MLKEKVLNALNEELNKEFYSAYLYLGMSSYFEARDLPGFANFMRVQWEEEMSHAMRIYTYINEVGGKVRLKTINAVEKEWNDVIEVFEDIYKHECFITESINEVLFLAQQEKDYATMNMLQWFISEQVEEEANMLKILNQLKLINGEGTGLFMIDRELGQRVAQVPLNSSTIQNN
ncbi:ferritin [Hypnocyclicus thermotrophus]|uniref:Ferritin n=1 Tax=Hypnocyclicus thermotrophus TaxID=1627895 RepID=A0AA46DYT3_9FUSO|nr:ferritin [Hypnocyclicus thermotrophus]TDT70622.1 ferritin [Hypnocyclicus thermotrophus]